MESRSDIIDSVLLLTEQCEKDQHLFDGLIGVIPPKIIIENEDVINWEKVLPSLEKIIRTCWKSERKDSDTCESFVGRIVHSKHHESTIEHCAVVTFRMFIDRGISHEAVRHRIAGHTQESTRYVDYVKKGGGQVIYPHHLYERSEAEKRFWYEGLSKGFEAYHRARNEFGWRPEDARCFLPTATKTELITTFNFRSLRNFFKLRCAKSAHPDMQVIANRALTLTTEKLEVIFDDFLGK